MSYVPTHLRQLVIERAKRRCEYCLFPQSAARERLISAGQYSI